MSKSENFVSVEQIAKMGESEDMREVAQGCYLALVVDLQRIGYSAEEARSEAMDIVDRAFDKMEEALKSGIFEAVAAKS